MTQPSSTKAQLAQSSSKNLTEFTRVRDLVKRKKNLVQPQPYNSNIVSYPKQTEEPEQNPYGIQTVIIPEAHTEKSIKKKYQEYASQNIRRNFFTSQRGRLHDTRLERSHDVTTQARFNSSIEELESQWKTIKKEHNFEARGSQAEAQNVGKENNRINPHKLELKSLQERRQASCEQRRESRERSLQTNHSFLLSKRVPQAKINLTDYTVEQPTKKSAIAFTSPEAVLETSLDHDENILSDHDNPKTQPSHQTPVRQTRLKFKSQHSPLRSNSVDKNNLVSRRFEDVEEPIDLFSDPDLLEKKVVMPGKTSSDPHVVVPLFLNHLSSPNPKTSSISKLLTTPAKSNKLSVKVSDEEASEYNYIQPKFEIIREVNLQKTEKSTKLTKKTSNSKALADKKQKGETIKYKSKKEPHGHGGENHPFFSDKPTNVETYARQRASLTLNPQFRSIELKELKAAAAAAAKKDQFSSSSQSLKFNPADLQTPTKIKIPKASQYFDTPSAVKTSAAKGKSKKEDYSDDIEEYLSEESPVKGNEFTSRIPPVFETKAVAFSSPNKDSSFEEPFIEESENPSASLIKKVQEKILENNHQVSQYNPKFQTKKEEQMFSPPQTKLRKTLSNTLNEASLDKMKSQKSKAGDLKNSLQKTLSQSNNPILNVVLSPKIPHKILSPSHEMQKDPNVPSNSNSFHGSSQGQYWDKLKKKYVINLKLHV